MSSIKVLNILIIVNIYTIAQSKFTIVNLVLSKSKILAIIQSTVGSVLRIKIPLKKNEVYLI